MGLERHGEQYEKRTDPRGRNYFWATNLPPPRPGAKETDLTSLEKGDVTLTALHYDMTHRQMLEEMRDWNVQVPKITE